MRLGCGEDVLRTYVSQVGCIKLGSGLEKDPGHLDLEIF